MSELKPCPFCGGEARYNRKQMSQGCVLIGYDCEQCGAAASVFTGPAAIEKSMKISAANAWNRRAAPENKPLTLEQLRKMGGEPVWIALLNIAKQPTCEVITKICEDGIHTVGTEGSDYASFGLYGKTWLAYRRPPEAGETK